MTRAAHESYPAERAWDAHRAFSVAVDQMRLLTAGLAAVERGLPFEE